MASYFLKRGFDIVFSLLLFLIASPIMIIVAAVIFFESGRPVLFKQIRLGRNLTPFTIYKFRTMNVGAHELQKKGVHTDDLITKPGRIIRKLHFDEFLQLLNILKGDMSVVGPRPTVPDDLKQQSLPPGIKELFDYRPGLTGLNDVLEYLKPEVSKKIVKNLELDVFSKLFHKKSHKSKVYYYSGIENDIYYLQNESLLFDLKIIWWTGLVVLEAV